MSVGFATTEVTAVALRPVEALRPDTRHPSIRGVLRRSYAEPLADDARVYLTERARRRSRHLEGLSRGIDIVLAAVGIVVTAPLMAAVAVAVRCSSTGPVLFRQTRLGRHGRSFTCFKFRTMVHNAEELLDDVLASDPEHLEAFAEVYKLPVDPRVTRLGRFLRSSSLDELPQLFNVLRGEMSVVGPRPLVPQELWRYGGFAPVLLQARPGLTGPWQIGGRSNLPYAERVVLDVEYVLHRTVLGDLRLAIETLPRMICSRGDAR